MQFLDIRTVLFSQLITDSVCVAVLIFLWIQNRRRFLGMHLWAIDFAMQTVAIVLVFLRGGLPDWASIGFTTPLVMVGAWLGYAGLERFLGKPSRQGLNAAGLLALILANSYFTFLRPNLEARNFILSVGLLFICFQCSWLLLRRVGPGERGKTLKVGVVFSLFCLVSLARMVVILVIPDRSTDFFHSGIFETLIVMIYQILLILLTFGLTLLVNDHLIGEARTQEEKFTKVFHSSPYAILLTRAADGLIVEANDGLTKLTGYTPAEAIGKTTLELKLWAQEEDRAKTLEEVFRGGSVFQQEVRFRKKSGGILPALFSADLVRFHDQDWILASISDYSERKAAEQLLRDNQARFHQALEAVQGGVWEWDLQTNENYWSEELWRVYGLEPHSCQPSYEAWLSVIHPDDREQAAAAVRAAADGGTELNAEWRVADGSGRWLMSRGQPVRDAEGKLIRYIGTVLDITARKQGEATLTESEQRYRSLFENMLNGFAYCQMFFKNGKPEDFTYLAVNAAFEKLTGLKDVVGKKVSEVIPGIRQSDPGLFETYGRVARSGHPETFEIYVEALKMWFAISVYSPQTGYFVAVFDVISERKLAEEALRQSQVNFARAFTSSPAALAITRLSDGKFLSLNEAYTRIMGYTPEDIVGRTTGEMNIYADANERNELIGQLREKGMVRGYELEAVSKSGQVRSLLVSMETIQYDHEDCILSTFIDITERKQIEAARQQSELLFRTLFELSPDAIVLVDPHDPQVGSRIVDCNAAASRMNGYSRQEMIGQSIDLINAAPYDESGQSAYLERLHQERVLHLEVAHRRKDGTIFPVEVSTTIIQVAGKELLLGIDRDITERKQAEDIIRKNESRLSYSLRSAELGAWELNLVDGTAWRSLKHDQIFGYASLLPEWTFDMFVEHVLPEDREMVREKFEKALATATDWNFECRIRREDGVVRWIWAKGNPEFRDTPSKPAKMFGIVQDITERKDTESRYRELVQNANSAILRWRSDGAITFFNEFAESFFGYPATEMLGKDVNILVPRTESTGGDLSGLVHDILEHPENFVNVVNENICRDGRRVWMAWTNKPILDGQGRVAEILAVGVDITERKKAEEELKLALDELKRSNAELEQFAYVASHDLQEPLRMVSSYMQLLERRYKGKLDQDADDFISYAVDGSERMRRLINDLLTFSRVGTRGQPLVNTSCESALAHALENLQVSLKETKARVTHAPLPDVLADETQLVQLFQNLIGNALKFHGEKAPRVHVAAQATEKEWIFSVKDNGIGIDPQYAERIFIIFQRLHSRDKYEGTGIGLAICRKIVQRHGGRIWVESQPDKGSTFFFTLPR